jgi:predicted Rossmann fold nucleotide-binding protein DprA/Smf involved in DNA uptake
LENNKVGMTGTRNLTSEGRDKIIEWVNSLPDDTMFFHGACFGADSVAAKAARERGLYVVAVIPDNKSQVNLESVRFSNKRIFAGPETSSKNCYRIRNELLVSLVDSMAAFWTGKKRYSGTWMTINIANKASVPVDIIMV